MVVKVKTIIGGYYQMNRKMSKFTTSALAATLVVSAASGVAAATPTFKDVPEKHTFFKEIEALSKANIVTGVGNGYFSPDTNVTRGQFAKMVVKALDLKSTDSITFKDVPATNIFYNEVNILGSLNISVGDENGNFNPNKYVTREQIALFLSRALQITSNTELPFEDVTNYKSAIAALYEEEIIKGKTATKFDPKANATRGEVAALITRTINFEEKRPFSLDILHVNDLHANVEKYPKIATAVKEQRVQKRDSLLLNAGDVFSGTLYFNVHEGKADTALLNLLNIDAGVFGNHEFDLGSSPAGHASLKTFVETANYPFLAANLDFSKDAKFDGLQSFSVTATPEDGKIYNGIIKEVKGEKVGIFGLTTEETKDIASPGSIAFKNYIDSAKAAVAAFEAQGVDKIIALTHIGFDDNVAVDNDKMLAAAVPGIDVIVGGHTHSQLKEPFVVDKDVEGKAKDLTIIVQAYQYADYLGTVNVEFDDKGVITNFAGGLITLSGYANDEAMVKALATYKEGVEEFSKQQIGVKADVPLLAGRTNETVAFGIRNSEQPIGNLITDGMLNAARKAAPAKNVIFAVTNGGGIRATIPAGEITVGQVKTVLPFGNTLAVVDVTGEEIKSMFEHSLKEYPKENGGFLHISGAKLTFDSSKAVGERVVKVEYLNDQKQYVEIDLTKTYTIATNAFTVVGGDGYSMLLAAYNKGLATDFGTLDSENFEAHLKSLGTITEEIAKVEGRIIDINTAE